MPTTQRWPMPFAPLTDLLRALVGAGIKVPIYCEASRLGDATRFIEAVNAAELTTPTLLLGGVSGDSLLEAISVARGSERIGIVTNGMYGVGEVDMAVAALGANRVVFGSGAPVRSLGAALALVRRSGLTPGDLEMVLGGNAKRLLASGGAAA